MAVEQSPLYLYNTLKKKKEAFVPIGNPVRVYSCGPTVYDYAHIGNFRAFLFADFLIRVLKWNRFNVNHVENITDVGHLTDNVDFGVDKIEQAAKKHKLHASKIAEYYTENFIEDSKKLNLLEPLQRPRASKFLREQINFIKKLEKVGLTYKTSDGIYFNTTIKHDYGKLIDLKKIKVIDGARIQLNPEKKNPADFALWKFSKIKDKRHMEWDSPWGVGFPGWHIECSAISLSIFGFPFDIHTGGIDHIPVHHTNEIAQNEALFGSETVKYWMHNNFITVDGEKMSKSLGNTYTLKDLIERGHTPLAFRYLTLGTHYRQVLNFTWDSLDASESTLRSIKNNIKRLRADVSKWQIREKIRSKFAIDKDAENISKEFTKALNDDLSTPVALAVVWNLIKNHKLKPVTKLEMLRKFDEVLGLDLFKQSPLAIPEEIQEIADMREIARTRKDWDKADMLREKLHKKGYMVEDTTDGPRIFELE